MAYNGSGSYSPPSSSFPAVSGALIESAKFNNIVNDIASALSTAITKDGQTTVTANLPMAGYRHTGVGNAVARTDYAAAGQAQDGSMTWAGTAGGTADAITLSLTPPITAYATGQSFLYKSGASANTGAMTVNINGAGAKAIQKNGAAMAAGDHAASKLYRLTFDGTAFQIEKIAFGMLGTTTNNNAATGYIGEYIESIVSSVPGVSVTNAVDKTVASISLTAGDWDVTGTVGFDLTSTTGVTALFGCISTATNTGQAPLYQHRFQSFSPGAPMRYPVPMRRMSLSSTTTIYLVGTAAFSGGTAVAYGNIEARRVR